MVHHLDRKNFFYELARRHYISQSLKISYVILYVFLHIL